MSELVGRPGKSLGRIVQTHPIAAFFVLTFAFSWGLFALLYGVLGPERIAATRSVWHYPWLLLGGAGYESAGVGMLVTFPIGAVLMSVVFAWLFNASGGVVPVVMVTHATVNATPVLEVAGTAPGWVSTLEGLLLLGAVAFPIIVYGRAYLAASGPDSAVLEYASRHSKT